MATMLIFYTICCLYLNTFIHLLFPKSNLPVGFEIYGAEFHIRNGVLTIEVLNAVINLTAYLHPLFQWSAVISLQCSLLYRKARVERLSASK